MALLSDDLMISCYNAHYFSLLLLVLGGVRLHQPLTAPGDVNAVCQTQARTFMHIQCENIFTPRLASSPTDSWLCSGQLLYKECDVPEQMRCLLSQRLLLSTAYAHIQWQTYKHTHMLSDSSLCVLSTVGDKATFRI